MPIVTITPINIGAVAEDPAADDARAGGDKINDNFTALKAAVDPIEASATADMTAAEIRTALLTVDGAGSAIDADLLDGQHAAAFATAAQGALADTATQPGDLPTFGSAAEADTGDFAAAAHTHALADVTSLVSSLAAKADLVGGVIPTAQIPAIAITTHLGTVASQVAMLALVGQQGDWAIRSDLGTVWIIIGADPTQLADWQELEYPASPVTSVNTQTGAVVLGAGDVGAATTAQGATADAALPMAGGTMTGNIAMSGAETVDGRDVSVDGTKLDSVQSGAQVNPAIASQAEAEAGTDNVDMMTALRVAQAMATGAAGMPLISGPGQGAGNVITKTLAAAGDFTTVQELMEYISENHFDNVELVVNIAAGTYPVGAAGADGEYNYGAGNGIAKLSLIGVSAATSIIDVDGAGSFLTQDSGFLHVEKLTINDLSGNFGNGIDVHSGRMNCDACVFTGWGQAISQEAGFVWVSDTTITPLAGGGTGLYSQGGTMVLLGSSNTILGVDDLAYGLWAEQGLIVCLAALIISNCAEAFHRDNGGRIIHAGVTLTSNVANYNVPLNEVHGDGGYITNGGLTVNVNATNVNTAGAVMETDYNANTILAATADNTPVALTIDEQRLVGRITAGAIAGLTATQARTLLNVEDGATNDQTAAEILAALLTVDGAASGLDADLLDGNSAAAFATAAQGAKADTATQPAAVWNVQSGTSYTLQASDAGKNVGFTNGAAVAVTLPDGLAVDFQCSIFWLGVGLPTVTPATDTVNGAGTGVAPSARWKAMYLSKYVAATWVATF